MLQPKHIFSPVSPKNLQGEPSHWKATRKPLEGGEQTGFYEIRYSRNLR